MAIDSRNKRASVIQLPPLTWPPTADGTLDEGDRMQIHYLYAVGAGAPVAPSEEVVGPIKRKGAAVRIIPYDYDWWREDDELFVVLQ